MSPFLSAQNKRGLLLMILHLSFGKTASGGFFVDFEQTNGLRFFANANLPKKGDIRADRQLSGTIAVSFTRTRTIVDPNPSLAKVCCRRWDGSPQGKLWFVKSIPEVWPGILEDR